MLLANDAAPVVGVTPIAGTWVEYVAVGASCLLFALLAVALAYLARRHLKSAPSWVLVPLCGVSLPLLLFVGGYLFFNRDVGLVRWLAGLPFRAYRNLALIFICGMAAAWLVLRKRAGAIDLGAFE